MPPKKWGGTASLQRHRQAKQQLSLCTLLLLSAIIPLVFFARKYSIFTSHLGRDGFLDGPSATEDGGSSSGKLRAVDMIDTFFPKEVLDVIIANSQKVETLGYSLVRGKQSASSLVEEEKVDIIQKPSKVIKVKENKMNQAQEAWNSDVKIKSEEQPKEAFDEDSESFATEEEHLELASSADLEAISGGSASDAFELKNLSHGHLSKRQMRLQRRQKRLKGLMQQDEEERVKLEDEVIEHPKEVHNTILGKYSVWRHDESENSESLVHLMRDQIIMARAFASIAQTRRHSHLSKDLNYRIQENQHCVGEANIDADLCRSAPEKIRAMGQMLTQARKEHSDCSLLVKRLRIMLQSAEEQARTLKKRSTFLGQLAAKTIPKGVHCLSLLLNVEYHMLPPEKQEFANQENLEDTSLYHYALFSDNIFAASVVVNSVASHAKEPEKHVFHLVTDKLNFAAMKMWFLSNPPGKCTVHVENVDSFTWLNSSYCPVLRQLEHKSIKDYYFKQDQPTSLTTVSSNLKYRNPKYLSMLNHLRFYLPQIYPKLSKILFLDDDIVVQRDLTPLWTVDLHGKVNGAVETCKASFHRFDKYLNFSHPLIARNFNPSACGWAYGMNIFDLDEWKKKDITGIYHKWQNLNEDRVLWKLGTLPPGLITFYNLTYPLNKHWHVLGLGYNPNVDRLEIENAAVIHYNGNLKPWLDIGLTRYKSYWTKYVKFDNLFMQQCNINE